MGVTCESRRVCIGGSCAPKTCAADEAEALNAASTTEEFEAAFAESRPLCQGCLRDDPRFWGVRVVRDGLAYPPDLRQTTLDSSFCGMQLPCTQDDLAPLLRATTTAATEDEIEDEMHDMHGVFSAMREGSGPVCWACVQYLVMQMTDSDDSSHGNRPTNVPGFQRGGMAAMVGVVVELCAPA